MEHRVRSQELESRIQENSNQNRIHLSYCVAEPQNVESASGGNIEVITSSFCGFLFCGSIFSTSVVCRLSSNPMPYALCPMRHHP
jgi:hypothetical protein